MLCSATRAISCFFFNDTATTEIYTLSLPTLFRSRIAAEQATHAREIARHRALEEESLAAREAVEAARIAQEERSEEHTSELQSRQYLVCRLLLEKKKITKSSCLFTYK